MTVKLLNVTLFGVSKLKRGFAGSSESTLVKMSHCWKSHVAFHIVCLFSLFDFILYVPSTIFQLNRDGSSWVEQVLS